MSAGLLTLLLCLALALVLVAVGAVRAVRDALHLKKRLLSYRNLPILAVVTATEQRVAGAQRRIDGLTVLAMRVDTALAELTAARKGLRDAALATLGLARALPQIVIDNLPAIFATRVRTRGN